MEGKHVIQNYLKHATISNKNKEINLCWKEYELKKQLAPKRARQSPSPRRSHKPHNSTWRYRSRSRSRTSNRNSQRFLRRDSRSMSSSNQSNTSLKPKTHNSSWRCRSRSRSRTSNRNSQRFLRRDSRSMSSSNQSNTSLKPRSRSSVHRRRSTHHRKRSRSPSTDNRWQSIKTGLLLEEERRLRLEVKREFEENAEQAQKQRRALMGGTTFTWSSVASHACDRWGHDGFREMYDKKARSQSPVENSRSRNKKITNLITNSENSDSSSSSSSEVMRKKKKKKKKKKSKKSKKKKKRKFKKRSSPESP